MTRWLRITLAWVGALVLVLIGMALWTQRGVATTIVSELSYGETVVLDQAMRGMAVGSAAAGMCVFLWLVADDLCREAPVALRGFLELFTGLTAAGALAWTMWLLW